MRRSHRKCVRIANDACATIRRIRSRTSGSRHRLDSSGKASTACFSTICEPPWACGQHPSGRGSFVGLPQLHQPVPHAAALLRQPAGLGAIRPTPTTYPAACPLEFPDIAIGIRPHGTGRSSFTRWRLGRSLAARRSRAAGQHAYEANHRGGEPCVQSLRASPQARVERWPLHAQADVG
jgi:hypothetical protein